MMGFRKTYLFLNYLLVIESYVNKGFLSLNIWFTFSKFDKANFAYITKHNILRPMGTEPLKDLEKNAVAYKVGAILISDNSADVPITAPTALTKAQRAGTVIKAFNDIREKGSINNTTINKDMGLVVQLKQFDRNETDIKKSLIINPTLATASMDQGLWIVTSSGHVYDSKTLDFINVLNNIDLLKDPRMLKSLSYADSTHNINSFTYDQITNTLIPLYKKEMDLDANESFAMLNNVITSKPTKYLYYKDGAINLLFV